MRLIKQLFIPLSILVLIALACNRPKGVASEEVIAPKPEAYHRVQVYEEVYQPVIVGPLWLHINAQATHTIERHDDGSHWLTIAYPEYGAKVYCTVTPTDDRQDQRQALDNRLERIRLNAGGLKTEGQQVPNAFGLSTSIYRTPDSRNMPLQLLAVGPDALLSGSVFFENVRADAPLDSLKPMNEAIEKDLVFMLKNINYGQ